VGRGHLRASHADREHMIGVLKAAFVQGRLTKDELDTRVGQTFVSRTYGELAAVIADLPPGLITAPPGKPARARTRPPVGKMVAGAVLIVPAPAMVVAAFLADSESVAKVTALVVLVSFMAWCIVGLQIIADWHDNHSRGQLPPQRGQRGQALEGKQIAGTGDDLMLSEAHKDGPRLSLAWVWSCPAYLAVTVGTPGPAQACAPNGRRIARLPRPVSCGVRVGASARRWTNRG
jgi:Domain of unknown function (DUF1707)